MKVLKVKLHEHPEVCMLKNILKAMQEAVEGYIDIIGLDKYASYYMMRKTDWLGGQQENR